MSSSLDIFPFISDTEIVNESAFIASSLNPSFVVSQGQDDIYDDLPLEVLNTPPLSSIPLDTKVSTVTVPSLPSNVIDDPWLGYDPFDSEWALNIDFNQVALNNPVISPVNSHLSNHLQVTNADEDAASSTHSLNTLIGWANHNPWEDEAITDDDSLSNYY
ncbi:hypothetical protein L1987_23935 [Smallanthus sonchifolius]|uniref:Uncharacterized protein n=1 Tax=Smallanthus sonchifolius TaxID=185202 RepID=A0ACB9IKS8_9ASTR|nr:hypothetical protein L1987_23935 [Smallanthus sonchifolius]